jgi:hypothetical protein
MLAMQPTQSFANQEFGCSWKQGSPGNDIGQVDLDSLFTFGIYRSICVAFVLSNSSVTNSKPPARSHTHASSH